MVEEFGLFSCFEFFIQDEALKQFEFALTTEKKIDEQNDIAYQEFCLDVCRAGRFSKFSMNHIARTNLSQASNLL